MSSITATQRTSAIANFWVETLLGVTLLFACAQVRIPLQPVPITLQTFAVMFIALTMDRRTGLTAIGAYILAGLVGVPVWSGYACGLTKLLGATGGYVLGFVACIYVMNAAKSILDMRKNSHLILNCLLGTAVIFAFGITWLSVYVGLKNALLYGLLPFLVPGIAKAFLLATVLQKFRVK